MSLKIFEIYENTGKKRLDNFSDNTRSTLNVDTEFDKVEVDFEWLDLMEDTVRYLDNILRNPNRFIVNEEEIVKVELARRITVESIKHLSRNTNLIQDINDKGEVQPSKVLNINKEESLVTYENRFVYTLIHHMQNYLDIKKKDSIFNSQLKDYKKMDFQAKSTVGNERINMQLIIDSKIDSKKDSDDTGTSIAERFEKMELEIKMLMGTDVYRTLDRACVALVIPPIKKTNVILKNVNFQYAIKLWDFLQRNPAEGAKRTKKKKSYEENGLLKDLVNENFLLNYIALSTLSVEKTKAEKEELTKEMTNNLIERIIELNADMPEEKLNDLIGKRLIIARTKKVASLSEIQDAFSRQIKSYLDKIDNFKFRGGQQ